MNVTPHDLCLRPNNNGEEKTNYVVRNVNSGHIHADVGCIASHADRLSLVNHESTFGRDCWHLSRLRSCWGHLKRRITHASYAYIIAVDNYLFISSFYISLSLSLSSSCRHNSLFDLFQCSTVLFWEKKNKENRKPKRDNLFSIPYHTVSQPLGQ